MTPKKTRFVKALAGLPTRVSLVYARCKPGPKLKTRAKVVLSIDEPPPEEVVVVLQFSEAGFGFGEVTLKQTKEGLFLDTECMSLDRVKGYFDTLLSQAILDTTKDPKKHKLYNRVTGRMCGPRCLMCYPAKKTRKKASKA